MTVARSPAHDGRGHAVEDDVIIRTGCASDIPAIKAIADRDKHALGFVHRGSLARAAGRDELIVASVGNPIVGFCQFYRRRDGIVSLYHVAVVAEARGKGIGRALLAHLRRDAAEHGAFAIRLKCPADLPANAFYSGLGFLLVEVDRKHPRPLNVWELSLGEEMDSTRR